MMIRTLAMLLPLTITPLLAVETVESLMIRGPLSHITMTVEQGTQGIEAGRSEVVSGLSILPASASTDDGAASGLNLLHALRF